MKRFETKATPWIYLAIVLSIALVFTSDFYTKQGIAEWIFYLVPVVFSFYAWKRGLPILIGIVATVLMVVGFYLSPSSEIADVAILNRTFGVVTIWILSGIGYQFIGNKLNVRQNAWLQSGQTQLSAKMVGDRRLDDLGESVLRSLAEYLDAQAGAIFIEDEAGFRRFATYATTPESVRERFASGEGLIGQAVKDRRPFIVENVPEKYLAITSGLGESRPRNLVVAPMLADGTVNAVLELGFFRTVGKAETELINRVAESVGIAIRSAKYRTRLQELLEETQRQSEELQMQSEELRVSNEELEEQSRALKESQARLELQQAELEQTNAQLEEQTQLLETQKDEVSRAKNTLEGQARELQQASRYKSDFLANMSHELRTPLNSSLILAKLLADNPNKNLTPDQVKYALTIQAAGNDLLALINDVLDLSKVESGRMDIYPEKVRIARLLDNLRGVFEPIAKQKGLSLRIGNAADTPENIETDSQRLEQVLKNLISNAIKFTEQGEVILQVNKVSEGKIAFAVSDTGIGIPDQQQQIIFEPFRQADGTTNRKYGGTGLGLSISREFISLLGGEIHLSSQAKKGSTFTVTLPEKFQRQLAKRADPTAVISTLSNLPPFPAGEKTFNGEPSSTSPQIRAARMEDDREHLTGNKRVILIVEDDESFARILSDLAHDLDFQSLIAETASEALALAPQYLPSAVILDVGLPDNSGLAVLDRLKRDSRTRHIPVHVVSGSDYAQTALSLGAVGYMLKPVKREQLVEAFQNFEIKLTQKMRRVLVVEDDRVQLESLQSLLGTHDVETVGAQSVAECLEKLKTTTFDCMVLDISLPDASGFSLLETLSHEDTYSFPPVIVYTGRSLTSDEEQKLRQYSKSIIIKGAKSPERLLDEVTLFLHQVVSELPAEQQKMLEKARSRDETMEGRRILVVEDDVRNVFALTSILEPKGIKLQIARNGLEALKALENASADPALAIDLVLMDVMMPEMDGITAVREIRKRPEWKKLPIIVLTAKAMKNDQEQCLQSGANDYMAKPLDVEKLLSLVRVWMPR